MLVVLALDLSSIDADIVVADVAVVALA